MARKNTERDGRPLTGAQMADEQHSHAAVLRGRGTDQPGTYIWGQRRYSDEDGDRLRELVELREAGVPLPELRDYAHLHSGDNMPAHRLELLLAHEVRLRARLMILRRHLRATERRIERHRNE